MKDANITLLEIFNHAASSHPDFKKKIKEIIFKNEDIESENATFLLALNRELLSKSNSQIKQDLFVLSELNYKKNGFFVEFGACDGLIFSNSYLLEKEFGWKGILAEPAKCWHNQLKNNRNCWIETDCVWGVSDSFLTFNETDTAELSTIDNFGLYGDHALSREKGNTYSVKTISLNDLLEKYNAPKEIDYLSIDTEGSELEILSNFDFSKYSFRVITCEHNYTPMREKIFELLINNGYLRVFEEVSKFDDWYVKRS